MPMGIEIPSSSYQRIDDRDFQSETTKSLSINSANEMTDRFRSESDNKAAALNDRNGTVASLMYLSLYIMLADIPLSLCLFVSANTTTLISIEHDRQKYLFSLVYILISVMRVLASCLSGNWCEKYDWFTALKYCTIANCVGSVLYTISFDVATVGLALSVMVLGSGSGVIVLDRIANIRQDCIDRTTVIAIFAAIKYLSYTALSVVVPAIIGSFASTYSICNVDPIAADTNAPENGTEQSCTEISSFSPMILLFVNSLVCTAIVGLTLLFRNNERRASQEHLIDTPPPPTINNDTEGSTLASSRDSQRWTVVGNSDEESIAGQDSNALSSNATTTNLGKSTFWPLMCAYIINICIMGGVGMFESLSISLFNQYEGGTIAIGKAAGFSALGSVACLFVAFGYLGEYTVNNEVLVLSTGLVSSALASTLILSPTGMIADVHFIQICFAVGIMYSIALPLFQTALAGCLCILLDNCVRGRTIGSSSVDNAAIKVLEGEQQLKLLKPFGRHIGFFFAAGIASKSIAQWAVSNAFNADDALTDEVIVNGVQYNSIVLGIIVLSSASCALLLFQLKYWG